MHNKFPLVNHDNSHYPGGFGSIENSRQYGLPIPSKMSGGGGRRKYKKNISNKYKQMKKGGTRRRKTQGRRKSVRRGGGKRLRRRGGSYHQYGSNTPISAGYSTAGIRLPSSQSALANPVPFTKVNTAIDNYNHNTRSGFQFW
jgi:hypothetical protein